MSPESADSADGEDARARAARVYRTRPHASMRATSARRSASDMVTGSVMAGTAGSGTGHDAAREERRHGLPMPSGGGVRGYK